MRRGQREGERRENAQKCEQGHGRMRWKARLILKNIALSYQMYNLFKFLRLKKYLHIIREKITMESFLTHNMRFGQVRSHSNLDLILTENARAMLSLKVVEY